MADFGLSAPVVLRAIVLGLPFGVGMSACMDRGRCLESHKAIMLVPIYTTTCNGAVCTTSLMMMIPTEYDACDSWEFPDGKPEEPAK